VREAGTVVVRDICRPKGPKNHEVLRRERSPSKAIVMRSLEEVLFIDEAPRPTNQLTNEVLNSGPTTRNRVCERDVPQASPIILRHVSHFPPLIGAIELHRIRSYLPRSRVCVCVSLALPPLFFFFFFTLSAAAPAAISAHIVFCRNSAPTEVFFFFLRNNYIFALRSSSSTAMAAALASTSSVASAATCFVQKSFPSSCSQRSVARPVVGKHSSLIFLLHCQVPVLPHLPDLPPATGSSTSSGRP
jgi:hypothetical protein